MLGMFARRRNNVAGMPENHTALLYVSLLLMMSSLSAGQNWPSFRGPSASGVVEGYKAPREWGVKPSKNILWRTPIPGLGHSSPVIWEDRVFVTTAIPNQGESNLKVGMYGDVESVTGEDLFGWYLYCIDRNSGAIRWNRQACAGKPKIKRHPKSSHANATPCTDGKCVVAFFGSEGLYCYDMDGHLLWQKDLGLLDWGFYRSPAAQWAGGSSPVIHDRMVFVQCDVQKDSFLAAFDLKDGALLWKTSRADVPTWGTPTVHVAEHDPQIIVNGYRHIGGYDIQTGKEIWRMVGGGDIPVPTPIIAHDLIYITNAHGSTSPIYAIRLSAKGDISLQEKETGNEHIAWSYPRGGNYIPTPIAYAGYLYCGSDRGTLSCFDPVTGKLLYRQNLDPRGAAFSSSPVATDGMVYFTAENGNVYVVQAGPEFKLLGVNKMDETCMATPAVSRGTLFFRTRHHLVAVAERRESIMR
jgi:outer membrane protein assembly factor BamB